VNVRTSVRLSGFTLGLFVLVTCPASPLSGAAAARDPALQNSTESAVSQVSPLGLSAETLSLLLGHSGRLRARFVERADSVAGPILARLVGNAVALPAVYPLEDRSLNAPFALIAMRPFEDKLNGRMGNYLLGYWPAERGRLRSDAYRNPEGFIEVTLDNQDTWVSEHFQLRDFLTKDQRDVWPKYLVLREELLDKLELVIADLGTHGVPVRNVEVMSGFRTPHYNALGVRPGGRARDSRHQFGDAADVFVDNDFDGRMDDLNRDRRVDVGDARIILAAVERVEHAHSELLGGVGLYHSTHSHGPFAHIDVRGHRARWAA
jgi:uncharacterized protein YcbK (DUF882 family)